MLLNVWEIYITEMMYSYAGAVYNPEGHSCTRYNPEGHSYTRYTGGASLAVSPHSSIGINPASPKCRCIGVQLFFPLKLPQTARIS